VLGLLRDDERESLEDGLIPIGLEVDDHVCYLGEIKFDPIEDLTGAGELFWGMNKVSK